MQQYYGPGEPAPVDRTPWLMKAARRFGAFLAGPAPEDLEPRKGGTDSVEAAQAILDTRQRTGQERDTKERRFAVPPAAMKQLADSDDIIFSIRRTLKNAIGEMGWKIVPDLDAVKDDLKRWESVVATKIALPGLPLEFVPQAMSAEIYAGATGPLHELLVDLLMTGVAPDDLGTNHRYRQFFENLVTAHDAIARSHVSTVKNLFDRPNPSAESNLRSFLDLAVDALTLYDSAAIVKNPTLDGKLGEIYTVPGWQVELYRNKDLSTPQPPYIAYHRVVDGVIKALYNNAELIFMMTNPQETGYGQSPIELLVSLMIGARYGDAYMIDWYSNNNMPFFVFDLGPNVGPAERKAAEQAWDQRVSRGKHRGIFVANKDNVKGFIPLPQTSNRDNDVMEQLKFWANRKCAAYGLSLNDIGFTEDLHRTTAETQAELTQARGVNSLATVIQSYINGEIVKGQMWLRDDPENPAALDGRLAPCFPFRDVKFEFFTDESAERLQKAQVMAPLVGQGILTINEARHELVLPNIPGGDEAVVFSAGSVRVRDLPDLPGPAMLAGAVPGADDQTDSAMPGGSGSPATPTDQSEQSGFGKGVGELDALANRLAKLAGGE